MLRVGTVQLGPVQYSTVPYWAVLPLIVGHCVVVVVVSAVFIIGSSAAIYLCDDLAATVNVLYII